MQRLFCWTKDYETKIDEVDEQHKYLVDLINEIALKISEKTLSKDELNDAFVKILDYTDYHFKAEESLMREKNIAENFYKKHINTHEQFIEQVKQLFVEIEDGINKEAVKSLLDFLISWLGFHILGSDQKMAEQIALIDSGMSAEQAYAEVFKNKNHQTEPLIKALNSIVDVVIKRNNELLELKRSLELKVIEKTRELSTANKILQTLATTDSLTNLPNRRYLFDALEVIIDEARQNSLYTSGLMMDLDNFKEVNDEFGHEMGDKVLKEFAQAIKEAIRSDDVFARLGGDEFFILLPDTDAQGAKTLACELLRLTRSLEIIVGDKLSDKWKSSVSIGVATLHPHSNISASEFMKRADLAVYAAKNAGKNCVRAYSEEILTN